MSKLPPKLETIVEDFGFVEGQEKLEYLLELSEGLPPLPNWLVDKREAMDQVHECMTPVFVYAELRENGTYRFHLDVPPEAPTVRGFASIMQQGFEGTTAEEVLAVPDDFYRAMGLQSVLTGQRLNGMSAILAHMKQLVLADATSTNGQE